MPLSSWACSVPGWSCRPSGPRARSPARASTCFDALPSEFTTTPLAQQSQILASNGTSSRPRTTRTAIIVPLDQGRAGHAEGADRDRGQPVLRARRHRPAGRRPRARLQRVRRLDTRVASTLTQQYVKLTLQDTALKAGDTRPRRRGPRAKKAYTRKLQELKYAITLEKKLTKDQILEGYLNIVYYGDRAYGVEARREALLQQDRQELNLTAGGAARRPGPEPRHDRPGQQPRARARPPQRRARPDARARHHHRQAVADAKAAKLADQVKVTRPRAPATRPRPTPTSATSSSSSSSTDDAPALGKTVEERRPSIYRGGLTITTTLDPASQRIAQAAIIERVPNGNDERVGAASVTVDPNTGKVLAMAPEHRVHRRQEEARQDRHQLGRRQEVRRLRRVPVRVDGQGVRPGHALETGLPINSRVDAKPASRQPGGVYTKADMHGPCGIPTGAPAVERLQRRRPPAARSRSTRRRPGRSTPRSSRSPAGRRLQGARHDDAAGPAPGRRQADLGKSARRIILGAAEVSPLAVASAYASLAADGMNCADRRSRDHRPDGKNVDAAEDRLRAGRRARRGPRRRQVPRERHDRTARAAGTRSAGGRRRPARPARPTTTTSPGSSATPRSWPPPSGSARRYDDTSRSKNVRSRRPVYYGASSAPRSPPRSGRQIMNDALGRTRPMSRLHRARRTRYFNGDRVDIGRVAGETVAKATKALLRPGFTVDRSAAR